MIGLHLYDLYLYSIYFYNKTKSKEKFKIDPERKLFNHFFLITLAIFSN